RSPLVQVMMALQNAPLGALELPGLELERVVLPGAAAKLDLTLSITPVAEGAVASWEHSSDLFDPTTIERFARRFETLLATAVADLAAGDGRTLAGLPLLTEAERQALVGWNHPATAASAACLPALVAAPARPHAGPPALP